MARKLGEAEFIQSWLYDEVTLAAGVAVNQVQLFVIPRGQAPPAGLAKTYTQTNLEGQGGVMTGINEFTIGGCVLMVESQIPTDDLTGVLYAHGYMEISQKKYPAPFQLKMLAGGVSFRESVRSLAAAPGLTFSSVGDGRIDNIVKFSDPYLITVGQGEQFNTTFVWDTPAVGFTPTVRIRLAFILYGISKRPTV